MPATLITVGGRAPALPLPVGVTVLATTGLRGTGLGGTGLGGTGLGGTGLGGTGLAATGGVPIMIADPTPLAGRAVEIVTRMTGSAVRLIEVIVIIGPQVPHPEHDDDHDQYDHSGQNDQRGPHGTIQHGVALGDARQSRAAINASLPRRRKRSGQIPTDALVAYCVVPLWSVSRAS